MSDIRYVVDGPDFSRRRLAGRIFENEDLQRAHFDGADLKGCVFRNCHLAESSFRSARASGMEATDCNFFRANFQDADLRDVLLRRCVLAGADLRGAKLRGLTVTLDCHSFENVRLNREAAVQLAFLFSLAESSLRVSARALIDETTRERLARIFER